ncbi:DNA-directed RNA polymerase subunit omega [Peptacetobacter hominis]|uniref:DNA-directed RNA polymerase subunit omega n=1 Tax=Peptacetobacter hominis TaxID=2743610 RepID=A0A544QUR2_9FIRM|nr:DNA-directed RNA polymerase subunit omega [Peptacetobacter hominis]TQQ84435.1 DNA-directed RNA polymerase subunit omega [Peptacetobacter hominis]
MLKPSINDVLEKIDNRYYLVWTVAKRARQLVDGAEPLVTVEKKEKPVITATKEVTEGKITYRLLTEEEIAEAEKLHEEEQNRQLAQQQD